VRIDFRDETPRDGEIPYLPAERYPFEPPYTAEEMGYRIMNFARNARWPHTIADAFGTITKAGYLSQHVTVIRFCPETDEPGVPGQLRTAPGDAFLTMAFYNVYPPRNNSMQGVWVFRRTDKAHRTKIDYFLYAPSLRRVRRLPQPRRDVPLQEAVQTFDDYIGRDAWEFSWRVIGSDVLYETVRFPSTRPRLTLARADGSFYDISTADVGVMGQTYPFYTEDGGVESLVLVADTRRDWLPNYGISKLIYWVDKHYFFPLRVEQYDNEGKLRTVQVRLARQENAALGPEGYTNFLIVYWDTQLDMISYTLHDAHRIVEWSEVEEVVMFSPEFMRRKWLKYAQATHAMVDSPRAFYMRPSLEAGKFPEQRLIHLAPDIEERIRAQESAGHLVFAASPAPDASSDAPK
jgi:hypothetical protein